MPGSEVASAASGSSSDAFHTLRQRYLEKCDEVETVTGQIQRAALDVQQLRLRLRANNVQDASLIPTDMRVGPHTPDQSTSELSRLIKWLAETVDLGGQAMFDVGGDVQVGERSAILGRMVQWRLPSAGGQKLSVPVSLQKDIIELLSATRSRGAVDAVQLELLARVWEIVGAEVMTPSGIEPAIFLIHRLTSQAMVVACWPVVDCGWHSAFDPREHFRRRSEVTFCEYVIVSPASVDSELTPDETKEIALLPVGAHVKVVQVIPLPQVGRVRALISHAGDELRSYREMHGYISLEDLDEADQNERFWAKPCSEVKAAALMPTELIPPKAAASACAAASLPVSGPDSGGLRPRAVSSGDRVEVEYMGEWFLGTLQWVEGDMANVKCDVDEPGIFTITPMTSVRAIDAQRRFSGGCSKKSGHVRAKSLMW